MPGLWLALRIISPQRSFNRSLTTSRATCGPLEWSSTSCVLWSRPLMRRAFTSWPWKLSAELIIPFHLHTQVSWNHSSALCWTQMRGWGLMWTKYSRCLLCKIGSRPSWQRRFTRRSSVTPFCISKMFLTPSNSSSSRSRTSSRITKLWLSLRPQWISSLQLVRSQVSSTSHLLGFPKTLLATRMYSRPETILSKLVLSLNSSK